MNRQQLKLLTGLPLVLLLVLTNQWEIALAFVAGLLYLAHKLSSNPSPRRWLAIAGVSFLALFLTTIRISSDDNRDLWSVTAPGAEIIYLNNSAIWFYGGGTFLGGVELDQDRILPLPTITPYPTYTPYPTSTPEGLQSA